MKYLPSANFLPELVYSQRRARERELSLLSRSGKSLSIRALKAKNEYLRLPAIFRSRNGARARKLGGIEDFRNISVVLVGKLI